MAEAYCVKCKAKREVKDPQHITMKNGKPALSGLCPVCAADLNEAGPEHRHEAAPDPRWAKLRELPLE